MLPNIGGGQLIILLVILLLLFGAKRIPELARSLGMGLREFRKGASGEKDEARDPRKEQEGKPLRAEETHDGQAGVIPAQETKTRAERKS